MKRLNCLIVVSLSMVALGGVTWAVDEDSPAGAVQWQWAEQSATPPAGSSVFDLATRNAGRAAGGTVITNESLRRLGDDEPFATEPVPSASPEISTFLR